VQRLEQPPELGRIQPRAGVAHRDQQLAQPLTRAAHRLDRVHD